mmetsp:Transcript_25502/g.83972  ORF Transcript_25502/g.83972 Transcript_25502/m.83972 type:complete len:852 (+) Transcript_25502:1145-3700(+)
MSDKQAPEEASGEEASPQQSSSSPQLSITVPTTVPEDDRALGPLVDEDEEWGDDEKGVARAPGLPQLPPTAQPLLTLSPSIRKKIFGDFGGLSGKGDGLRNSAGSAGGCETPAASATPPVTREPSSWQLQDASASKGGKGSGRMEGLGKRLSRLRLGRSAGDAATSFRTRHEHTDNGLVTLKDAEGKWLLRSSDGRRWLINPHSGLRAWLDLLQWCLVIYTLFTVPFSAAFRHGDSDGAFVLAGIELAIDGLFLMDVLLEMYTTRFDMVLEGYISDQQRLWEEYLYSNFVIDLFSSLPLELLALAWGDWHSARFFLRAIKMLRIVRLRDFGRGGQSVTTKRIYGNLLRLWTLLCVFVYLTHFVACVLYGLARFNDFPEESWTNMLNPESPLSEQSIIEKYLQALFYALTLNTGIGNTPVPPSLNSETVLIMLIMVTGSGFWAYAVGIMFDIIGSINRANNLYEDNLDKLKYWMEYREIPISLRKVVYRHFNYQYACTRFLDETEIISKLSPALQLRLRRYLCRGIVQAVPIFRHTPESFIDDIVSRLQPRFVSEGEVVCNQGEMGSHMYLIAKGSVEVLKQVNEAENTPEGDYNPVSPMRTAQSSLENTIRVTVLESGSFFGEIALIFDNPRVSTCRAVRPCDLFTLSKDDFNAVMASFPQQYEKMRAIAGERAAVTARITRPAVRSALKVTLAAAKLKQSIAAKHNNGVSTPSKAAAALPASAAASAAAVTPDAGGAAASTSHLKTPSPLPPIGPQASAAEESPGPSFRTGRSGSAIELAQGQNPSSPAHLPFKGFLDSCSEMSLQDQKAIASTLQQLVDVMARAKARPVTLDQRLDQQRRQTMPPQRVP